MPAENKEEDGEGVRREEGEGDESSGFECVWTHPLVVYKPLVAGQLGNTITVYVCVSLQSNTRSVHWVPREPVSLWRSSSVVIVCNSF